MATASEHFRAGKRYFCALAVPLVLLVLLGITFCHAHGHGHSHDEPDEAPSFKYSKQANEETHGHGHAHDDHGHGHAHDDHGHAHGHGHAHDHGHGHAHDHGHGHSHDHAHHQTKESVDEVMKQWATKKAPKQTGLLLWLEAIGATFFISVSPIIILLFVPIENANDPKHQGLLKILLSFASGGLLGDAFLHLIPHAVSPHSHGEDDDDHAHSHAHSHDHGHSHGGGHDHAHDMSVGLWVLAGIITFLCVEKVVRYVKGGHTHSHSHAPSKQEDKKEKDDKAKKGEGDTKEESTDKKDKKGKSDDKEDKKGKKKKEDDKDSEEKTDEDEKEEDIKVAGYLNLAADFAHNFTDGLAIGASFLVGRGLGIITTVTIFLHEIPHEIGDFAILVQSGCSKQKAMKLQFSTAIGAMMGTICSLLAEGIGDAATAWILPFTAGGFIYIATVSVIPELLEDTKLGQSIKEIAALLVGVYMMVLIGQFE